MWAAFAAAAPLGVPARGGATPLGHPTCVGLDNIGDMLYTAKLGLGTPPQVCNRRVSRPGGLFPLHPASSTRHAGCPAFAQYLNVVADTGSMDLLVLSSAAACQGEIDCGSGHSAFDGKMSMSLEHTDEFISASYGQGDVMGEKIFETAKLGELSIANQSVMLMQVRARGISIDRQGPTTIGRGGGTPRSTPPTSHARHPFPAAGEPPAQV